MKEELKKEIDRLKQILESNGLEFTLSEGVSDGIIANVETKIGFVFDEDLKEFWKLTNGSNSDLWFAVFSDEQTPCAFQSIEYAFEQWSAFCSCDNPAYEKYKPEENKRDERIQPILVNKFWFPFAEFNGFSTSVIFDADPTEMGNYGQIIVYQHDPDGIYYVADSFLGFFKKSNDSLEINFKDIIILD